MPNIATLVSEYMPKKNRAKMVNFMFCAFPLGITMGGLLSAKVIPSAGWSYMFIYCGILPFLLGLILSREFSNNLISGPLVNFMFAEDCSWV